MTSFAPGRPASGDRPASGADPDAAVVVPGQRRPPQAAAERRGRTEVSDRVVMKLACWAAREIPEVREVHLSGRPWSRASSAEVRRGGAAIHLNVSMVYPSPVRAVAARLREHVAGRVRAQTGLRVERVDLTVTNLDVTHPDVTNPGVTNLPVTNLPVTNLDVEGSPHAQAARERSFSG